MALGFLFWPACITIALLAIGYLSWYSVQHIQRAADAELSYRAERSRVLATYTTMHFRRIDDARYTDDPRAVGKQRY